ncbi:hypothetical protein [Chitinophaga tropicalis]|uniref:Uncharacterized protein n=1 Tax=Chitinophaga tropicalis TaxID=2683588 RepID=A0A7K1U3S1_9BACT|nr:hypothetical protein [Chitinophaga tropicalis]MVT09001.1 hypothetical protein [Chitinophaga tropicalis]
MTSILTPPIITHSEFTSIVSAPALLTVGLNEPFVFCYFDENSQSSILRVKAMSALLANSMESFQLDVSSSLGGLDNNIPMLVITLTYASEQLPAEPVLWYIETTIEYTGEVDWVEVVILSDQYNKEGPKRGGISVPKKGVES